MILFGASGMVGQGVLRECLIDPTVERVLSVGRTPIGVPNEKLQELVRPNLSELGPAESELTGYDAAFDCLGISSIGRSESDYSRVTYGLTMSIAATLVRLNPGLIFIYVSGAGTDSTEHGRSMWARVKGRTENALLRLPFRAAYMFRPGAIQPVHGVRSKTAAYRVIYLLLYPFLPLLRVLAPGSVTTSERVGRAMIRVAHEGASKPIIENRDINELGRRRALSTAE